MLPDCPLLRWRRDDAPFRLLYMEKGVFFSCREMSHDDSLRKMRALHHLKRQQFVMFSNDTNFFLYPTGTYQPCTQNLHQKREHILSRRNYDNDNCEARDNDPPRVDPTQCHITTRIPKKELFHAQTHIRAKPSLVRVTLVPYAHLTSTVQLPKAPMNPPRKRSLTHSWRLSVAIHAHHAHTARLPQISGEFLPLR